MSVVRLAGSGANDTGRLEVYYNGQWGTVCIDDFDDNDAALACYMLGFGYVHLKLILSVFNVCENMLSNEIRLRI